MMAAGLVPSGIVVMQHLVEAMDLGLQDLKRLADAVSEVVGLPRVSVTGRDEIRKDQRVPLLHLRLSATQAEGLASRSSCLRGVVSFDRAACGWQTAFQHPLP